MRKMDDLSQSGAEIAVLGGDGFLGTHLVNALLSRGARLRVYGRNPRERYRNGTVVAVRGNFANGSALEEAVDGASLVYHLVSSTIPSTSNADPVADVQSNLIGSLHLLETMKRCGVNRIVYASSGGTVYGNPRNLPVAEDHSLDPLCSYGIVKVAVEKYLNMFSCVDGITATVLRLSNPYGPLQRAHGAQGVISVFAHKILAGQNIEVWGDGTTVRDYIYIDDVIDAMVRAAHATHSGVYNIGSGVGHSLNRILEILADVMGKKANVRYLPKRSFDVREIVLDVRRARAELGWQPETSLEEGIRRYCSTVADQIQTAVRLANAPIA
ncbi:hypothetical protein B2G74_24220 [Burkholderia sp. A27]|nr:hypothetical protein B2G74_24220 [Burkholderia sp. A27]